MLIAKDVDKKLGVCDIETMVELFDFGSYDPDTQQWVEFEISQWKNDLFKFVHFYTSKPYDYLVTYNGISFDQQVMEWIVKNHQKWVDLTNLEITARIAAYAGKRIDDSNYNIQLPVREEYFSIPAIDVFTINHFDNEAKRTSLKWCEYMMNMDVEEMPVPHDKTGITQEEVVLTQKYRRKDCLATLGVLYITLGQIDKVKELNGGFELPELKDYKGKNKIQDRFDVYKETGMKCLNWSDVKIGEEWNKLDYKSVEGITDDYSLLPKKVTTIYGQKFKKFFPPTTDFTTDKLKKFTEFLGNQVVRRPKKKQKKQTYPVTIGQTTYTFAKGGIHSCEKHRKLIPLHGYILRDADVGAQYPNSILKWNISPPHLKDTILKNFDKKVKKKDFYKQLHKKLTAEGREEDARPYKGLETMTKLCMNGGYFGKLNQPGSFLEYQEGYLKVCVGNEIEILMLIEMMEEVGFQVLSGNTDGIVVMFPADKEDVYNTICQDWEKKVGNDVMGKLEYTDFKAMYQESINHYIAQKNSGEVKKKGRFCTEYEMHKDKSERIIPLALEAYFIDKKDPIEFITNHKNIFDFTICVKAFGKMYYEEQWEENGVTITKTHKKLVRYYISNKGTILYKRGINHEGEVVDGHVNAPSAIGQPLVTYFNTTERKENYDIDYSYYIFETLERIDKIEKSKRAEKYVKSLNQAQQTSLF